MHCLGWTKNRSRCKNDGSYFFCGHHKWQPIAFGFSILTIVGLFGGLYQDVVKPVYDEIILKKPEKEPPESLGAGAGDIEYRKIIAEVNRPIVELEKMDIEEAFRRAEGHVRFYFKNIGNLSARNVCVSIHQPFDSQGKPKITDFELISTCSKEDPLPRFGLRKNGVMTLPIVDLATIRDRIGYLPSSVSIHRGQPHKNIFICNIFYEGVNGGKYSDMFQFEFFKDEES